MAIEFAKATKVINVTAPQTSVFIQDLIDAIRDYEDNIVNMELLQIANATGKQDLGGGVLVGITLELINDWRIAFSGWFGPSTQGVSVGGGNLVATNQFSNNPILPTPFTQVAVQSSSSATISQLEIVNLQHMIESQRGTHTGYGDVFYWDPINGNDTNDGTTPSNAMKTFAVAQALTNTNNDDVIFVSTHTSPQQVTTEQIIITKNNLHIRGPGHSLTIRPTGSGPAILFSGVKNSTIQSFKIDAQNLTGSEHSDQNGIVISSGSNNQVSDIDIINPGAWGLHVDDSEDFTAKNISVENAGSHSFVVMGNSAEIDIMGCRAFGGGGDAFLISGSTIRDAKLTNNAAHSCSGYGLAIWGTLSTRIDWNNYGFNMGSGLILNSGINTGFEVLDKQARQTSGVWAAQISEHQVEGTFGQRIGQKLLTFIKFMGAK